MNELPNINGKTVAAIATIDYNGNIEEVRILFTDGTILVFTGSYNANHREGYIHLKLEPADTAEEDRAANEGRDASRRARWG